MRFDEIELEALEILTTDKSPALVGTARELLILSWHERPANDTPWDRVLEYLGGARPRAGLRILWFDWHVVAKGFPVPSEAQPRFCAVFTAALVRGDLEDMAQLWTLLRAIGVVGAVPAADVREALGVWPRDDQDAERAADFLAPWLLARGPEADVHLTAYALDLVDELGDEANPSLDWLALWLEPTPRRWREWAKWTAAEHTGGPETGTDEAPTFEFDFGPRREEARRALVAAYALEPEGRLRTVMGWAMGGFGKKCKG